MSMAEEGIREGKDPNQVARDFKRTINGGQEGPLRICFDAIKSGSRLTWRVVDAFSVPKRSLQTVADP